MRAANNVFVRALLYAYGGKLFMRYVISDIHGEYGLCMRLLDKIKFSASDVLYVCGDMVDKGDESVRLLDFLLNAPNVKCILGNHEYGFLAYYWAVMKSSPSDFDKVLADLQIWFGGDGKLLRWETVDKLEALPLYIEEEEFVCVHAGLPLDDNCRIVPPQSAREAVLLEDRNFMRPEVVPKDCKCVCFGHTPTRNVCGEDRILAYKRYGRRGDDICDYYKIHLDTGTWLGGPLGCFCIDTCRAFYVKEYKF